MTEKTVTANMQNVHTIAEAFYKILKKLQEMGVTWNMADLAVAYTQLTHELLKDLEKARKTPKVA